MYEIKDEIVKVALRRQPRRRRIEKHATLRILLSTSHKCLIVGLCTTTLITGLNDEGAGR